MKIMFYTHNLSIGGHKISALTLIEKLKSQGYEIIYVSDNGILKANIEKLGIKHFYIKSYNGSILKGIVYNTKNILKIIKREAVDIIHSYEIGGGAITRIPSIIMNIPVIITIAGGPLPTYVPYKDGKYIVFSEELKDGLIRKFRIKRENIYVIPNRIDTEKFCPGKPDEKLAQNLGINLSDKNILIISRFEHWGNKVKAITHILDLIPILYSRISNLRVFVVGKGSQQDYIISKIDEVNRKIGKEIIQFLGLIKDTSKLYRLFNLTFAMGRSALESMSCGIPTVIMGASGPAGIASPEKIRDLAYYNFSGRGVRNYNTSNVISEIYELLTNSHKFKNISIFSRNFVKEYYDVIKGVKKITKIYEDLIETKSYKTLGDKIIEIIHTIGYLSTNLYFRKAIKKISCRFSNRYSQ